MVDIIAAHQILTDFVERVKSKHIKFFYAFWELTCVLSGDGDCNHDSDCEGSLICGNNNCNQEVLLRFYL